jgi:hypothetical protein
MTMGRSDSVVQHFLSRYLLWSRTSCAIQVAVGQQWGQDSTGAVVAPGNNNELEAVCPALGIGSWTKLSNLLAAWRIGSVHSELAV